MAKTLKASISLKAPNGPDGEVVVDKLRKTINSINSTVAIYKNDIKRFLDDLKRSYGTGSVEEALKRAESINTELEKVEKDKATLLSKIKIEMEKYSNKVMDAR